ncbi:MAG: amidase [Variovorax sp.]|nr:amidase [Variovorax sp.]
MLASSPDPTWRLSAAELAAAYAKGQLDPVLVLRAVLERLQAVQPHIRAVVSMDESAALAAAQASAARWKRAAPLSPLDGVPLTVKDNIPVAGLPCQWGSRLFRDHRPARDESPVRRLRAAGAVIVGKTNVPEFTLQGYCDNALHGATHNPWRPGLTPGGSSGGAVAAVAAGVGPLALGTDGGGSIRRPCALTGLVGLKPSWGLVARTDGLPEILPGMEVVGPIARTTGDLRRMMVVLAPGGGFDAAASASSRKQRILHWRTLAGRPVDPEVTRSVNDAAQALRAMGHDVVEAEAPAAVDTFNREAWPVIAATGLAAVLRPHSAQTGELSPALARMLADGLGLRAVDLFDARQCVRRLRTAIAACLEDADLILTPSSAALAWPAHQTHPTHIDGQAVDARGHALFTAFVNATGLPALNLPARASASGLPIGFQLVGRAGSDAALCALGADFEAQQPWRDRWPAL